MSGRRNQPLVGSDMQDLFCREYLIDLDAKAAAKRAGYSEKAAAAQGSNLLALSTIQERIAELNRDRMDRLSITADHVVKELGRIALCDIGTAFNETNTLKEIREMPDDVRRCVQSIEVEEVIDKDEEGRRVVTGHIKKVKFWDKNKGLELLGKHFGLYIEKHEVTGSFTLEALVTASHQKGELHGENES